MLQKATTLVIIKRTILVCHRLQRSMVYLSNKHYLFSRKLVRNDMYTNRHIGITMLQS